MKFGLLLIIAALAIAPAAAPGAVVQFAAPAANLPAGHLRAAVYDAILPSGQIVTPFGASAVTGVGASGVALTPDGRFAIVSNDDSSSGGAQSAIDPLVFGGYALSVIDTATLRVIDRFAAPGETFAPGLAVVPDPHDRARTLIFAAGGGSGNVFVFDLDGAGQLTPDARHVIPIAGSAATLIAAPDGRRVYVVDGGNDRVAAIDPATRTAGIGAASIGYRPSGAAIAGDRLLVSNEGAGQRTSSLSLVGIGADGDPLPQSAALAMDVPPDGLRSVGAADPTAIAVTPDAGYAFVAMTNVDRIATVDIGAVPRVVGGTELRLFDRGPYGTRPAALALSHDGARLYVALAGLNAIAVLDARDPRHVHRLGLIPAGWSPCALALSPDDRNLFVLNHNGFGHEAGRGADAAADVVWSTLEKIDLATVTLNQTTYAALADTRQTHVAAPPSYPRALQNVVVIVEENKTFDAMLGDLDYGPADPRLVRFGAAVTPNLHALARRYGVAGNLYTAAGADDRHADVGADHAAAVTGVPRAGFIYHDLARHHVTFRDYGDCLRASGDDAGTPAEPVETVLAGHVDLAYPGRDVHVRNELRAREFIRDYDAFVTANRQPRYTHISLPPDRPAAGSGIPPAEQVADGDRALGTIVAYLSRLPSWRNTVVFVLPDGSGNSRDHVDASRAYALVISPFAKRRYVGMRHLSPASVLKTTEQILHVPPLSLGDLLATDMSDFFTAAPDARPFAAIAVPLQTADAARQAAAGRDRNLESNDEAHR